MSNHDVKQAYTKPEMVEYGKMERLTLQSSNASSGNANSDVSGNQGNG